MHAFTIYNLQTSILLIFTFLQFVSQGILSFTFFLYLFTICHLRATWQSPTIYQVISHRQCRFLQKNYKQVSYLFTFYIYIFTICHSRTTWQSPTICQATSHGQCMFLQPRSRATQNNFLHNVICNTGHTTYKC